MSELQKIQRNASDIIIFEYEIPFKNIESFPSYFTYEFQFVNENHSSFNYGLHYSYASTGARSYYADYSGEVISDYLLYSHNIGILLETFTTTFENHNIIIGGKIAYVYSDLTNSNYLEVLDFNEKVEVNFESSSFSIEPTISYQFSFGDLFARLNLSYLISIGGKFTMKNNEDIFINSSNGELAPEWSGYRIGISLGYILPFLQSEKLEDK
jgi:hypothetical protein